MYLRRIFLIYCHYRRVHITEETFGNLGGAFKVEDGNGASRDSALEGRSTYLVIDPNTENSTNTKPKVIVNCHLIFGRSFQNLNVLAEILQLAPSYIPVCV